MGYAYLSKGKKQGYKILIDEAMDISAVPGEKFFPGTEAVTADGATRFRLNNAHEWVLVYSSPIPVAAGPFLAVERLGPYMYSVSFDALPEDTGDLFITPMGCSSFVQEGKLYRNLDWNYAETAEFLVRTKNYTGMAFIDGLNDGELDAKKIAQLPYRVCDGVNGDGILVSTHVLFNDWDYAGSGEKTVPLTKIPHLILENVHSMEELETKLSGYLANIRQPEGDYVLQFLVTDGETTAVILPPESGSGEYEIVDATENPKLANFRWLADENVSLATEGLQDRPTGIERWNLMPCDLEDLRFTLAYEDDDRLSEFIGINGTTKESTEEELTEVYNLAHAAYISRTRNGETWQTMHSVVYSANGIESLHTQENWGVDYAGGGKAESGWPEDLPFPSEGGYGYTDEDETIHKIGNEYLPEISGLPDVTGSGKALVSVNGEWVMQSGYGYTGAGSETIVSETVFALVEGSVARATFTSAFELVAGNTYDVIISGVTYSGLVAVSLQYDIVAISDGNAATREGATFIIAYRPTFFNDRVIEFTDTRKTGNHTVIVRRVTEVVQKIDSKYLPEVGGDFIIEGTASMVESPMPTLLINDLSKTFAETKAAYLSGKTVKVKIDVSYAVFFPNAIGYQSSGGAEGIQFDGSAFGAAAGEFESTKSYISFALPAD